MPYYNAGDYYQGDYYQAGGFLGSIGKAIGGAVKGFIGGGPIGAFKGAAGAFVKPSTLSIAPIVPGQAFGGGMVIPTPGLRGFAQRIVPGGATGYQLVRSRRMNVANVRALRRALRRASGFERLAKRVGRFTQPGKVFRLKIRKRARAR